MLLELGGVLPPSAAGRLCERLERSRFEDGRRTAGTQAGAVKNNLELPPSHSMMALAKEVYAALVRHEAFNSFAVPRKVMAPIFSRYDEGMSYGRHSDVALMGIDRPEAATRTDLSVTVFLSDPQSYDGGELTISTPVGEHRFKTEAGSAVIYPCHFLHWVEPVTRGVRYAAVTWIQSFVRSDRQREILYELEGVAAGAMPEDGDSGSADTLHNVYHKLMRMWAEV